MQTEYNFYMDKATPGMLVDAENAYIESSLADGSVSFGLAVVPGTDAEDQVKTPSALTDLFRGIAVNTHAVQQNTSGDGLYADTTAVSVLRRGKAWVYTNDTVSADDAAYFVYTGADAGKFRNDSTNAVRVPGGYFRSAGVSGDLVVVEINLPAMFLRSPAYGVAFAASVATVTGATQTISVPGVVSTDIVFAELKTVGATPRTILTRASGTNAITVVMSGDPSTDHVISYQVLRAF